VRYLGFNTGPLGGAKMSGELLGQEMCRQLHSRKRLYVAIAGKRNGQAKKQSVQFTLSSFKSACPDIKVTEVWDYRCTKEDCLDTPPGFFISLPVPDVIMGPDDDGPFGAVTVARSVLPDSTVDKILMISASSERPDLLRKRQLIATRDPMIFHSKEGMWSKIAMAIKAISSSDNVLTTADFREFFRIPPESDVLLSNEGQHLIMSRDPGGLILDQLMPAYDKRVPPSLNVRISTGLEKVVIQSVDIVHSTFEAIVSLKVQWEDDRLVWKKRQYDGVIELEQTEIWTPGLHFANDFSTEVLAESLATITHDGNVSMTNKNSITLGCNMDVSMFPFDSHKCEFKLAPTLAAGSVTMDGMLGFDIEVTDSAFDTESSITYSTDKNGRRIVSFMMLFKRKPLGFWFRLIIPAILVNLVGFISFWVPDSDSSINLGITGLLCTLALRESIEMPTAADVSWCEFFLTVNLVFQSLVLFMNFVEFSSPMKRVADRLVFNILGLRLESDSDPPAAALPQQAEEILPAPAPALLNRPPPSDGDIAELNLDLEGASNACPSASEDNAPQPGNPSADERQAAVAAKAGAAVRLRCRGFLAAVFVPEDMNEFSSSDVLGQMFIVPAFVIVMAWTLGAPGSLFS